MAINRQALLRDAQTYSAPTRRALGTGLQDALLSTRYTDNPNVAALVTRQALRGYGEGLSSAVSSGQKTAAEIDLGYQGLDLKREQLDVEKEHYEDIADAYEIAGITELGLLANDLTGGAIGETIGKGVTALGSALGIGSTAAGTTAAAGAGTAAAVGGGTAAVGGGSSYLASTGMTPGFEPFTVGGAEGGAAAGMTGAALGTLGAVGGAVLLSQIAPPITKAVTSIINPILGMGEQTAPTAKQYLDSLQKGLDYVPGWEGDTQGFWSRLTPDQQKSTLKWWLEEAGYFAKSGYSGLLHVEDPYGTFQPAYTNATAGPYQDLADKYGITSGSSGGISSRFRS